MKRKLTYCLLALLLPIMGWGEDCVVEKIYGYRGGYGTTYGTQTTEYISTNPHSTYSQILPTTPDSSLTVYKIDAGRDSASAPPASTTAVFSIRPTIERPYFAVWSAVEMVTGEYGHEPVIGSIQIYSRHEVLGCPVKFNGQDLITGADTSFILTNKIWKEGWDLYAWYRPWQVQIIDLSSYVGEQVLVEAMAGTCSTTKCTSVIYFAFNSFAKIDLTKTPCSTCDNVSLFAPSGFKHYEWHKESPTGTLVGKDAPLFLEGQWNITNYYCTIIGDCGEASVLYPVTDSYALFSTDTHCGTEADTVYLTNLSYLQERVAPYTKVPAAAAHWDFGDGRTSDDPNLTYVVYPKSKKRQYSITLQAGNADLSCANTVVHTVEVCPVDDTTPLNPEILDCKPVFTDTLAYICYDDLPFIWHGKEASDGDTIILVNSVGCDSIVTLRLTVSQPMVTQTIDTTVCDTLLPILWRGHTYSAPDEYRDTVRNSHGCNEKEYIYRLDTIHCEQPLPPEPPKDTCLSNLVYQKWDDVIFCDNGKHEFVAFQWYKDSVIIAGETKQYLYIPGGFDAAEYQVEVTYADGTKLRTCPANFAVIPRSADTYVRIPTFVPHGMPLHIEQSDEMAELNLYTMFGQPVLSTTIGTIADIPLTLSTGVYVATLRGPNVKTTTKIMVE